MSRGIDLGDVTFGLNADTAGLDRALGKLRAYGQEVNKVVRSTEEGSAAMAAAMARQERLMANTFQKVTDLNRAIRDAGAPSQMLGGLTTTYRSLTDQLSKGTISSLEYGRAQTQVAARLAESRRELVRWTQENQRAMSIEKARTMAYAEDARRTQAMGRMQSTANTIDAGRTQMLGRQQSFAQQMDEARTRRLAILQMQAAAEDALRSQGKWHEALHNLGRAVVLIEGPLSGLGARMTVLSALFESSAMKMAITIAGVAALGAGVAYAGVAAVKATIQWQQWAASMTMASGASVLVAEDMKYIMDTSNKFGQSIQSTIPSWTSFATAARLAGLTIVEQKKVFESFMTAGSALHWGVNEVGRAFLALEQILSKGKPQMQEVRLQLGQVLLGAFGLAAKGMKMNTAELSKAMEQGKIDAKDFVLGISEAVEAAYRAASVVGRTSITADLQRFHNKSFELAKAFDDATKASVVFQEGVRAVTGVMVWAKDNMQNMVNATIALGGALMIAFAPSIIGLVGALATGIARAATAMWAFGAATAANPIGAMATLLLRLGLAVGVGAAAFQLLTDKKDKALGGLKEYNEQLELTLKGLEDVGEINDKTKQRLISKHDQNIQKIDEEIRKQQELTDAYKKQGQPGEGGYLKDIANVLGGVPKNAPKSITSDEYKAALDRQLDLLEQKKVAQEALARLNLLKVTNVPENVTEEDKATKSQQDFLNSLQLEADHLNESGDKYQKAIKQIEAYAMKHAKDLGGWGSDQMVAFMNKGAGIAKQIKDEEDLRYAAKRNNEEYDEREKGINTAKAALESYGKAQKELIEQTEHEYSLLGKTANERELEVAYYNRKKAAVEALSAANKIANESDRQFALDNLALQRQRDQAYFDSIKMRQAAERTWQMGVKTAFNAYMEEASNAAKLAEGFVTRSFQSMEDALYEFASTGKMNFRKLADSIIADLTRIMAKRAMMEMFGKGPVGSGLGSGDILGKAIGFIGGIFQTGFGDTAGLAAGVPQYASGTDYVPADMLAFVHKGEKITPASENKPSSLLDKAVTVINNFTISQPTDRRTQEQIAGMAGASIQLAMRRSM